MKKLLLTVLFLILCPILAHAESVDLGWEANTEPILAGYKIHKGLSSRNYDSFIDVGNVTEYTLTGLAIGTKYYLAASAYGTNGTESPFSDEVTYLVVEASAPASTSTKVYIITK